MSIFESKSEKIERLSDELVLAEQKVLDATIDRNKAISRMDKIHVDTQKSIEEIRNFRDLEVSRFIREISNLKEGKKDAIEDGIKREKKELKQKENFLDDKFEDKKSRLEKEYRENLSQLDRKLEEDKSSYRKYLKTEMNSKIEKLEKDNDSLDKENTKLYGEVSAQKTINSVMIGQVDQLSKTLEVFAKAFPQITAIITTPEVNVNNAGNNSNLKS